MQLAFAVCPANRVIAKKGREGTGPIDQGNL